MSRDALKTALLSSLILAGGSLATPRRALAEDHWKLSQAETQEGEDSPEASPEPEPETPADDGIETPPDDPSTPTQDGAPMTDQQNNPFNQQAFVPAISLILDTSLGLHNLDNETFGGLHSPLSLSRPEEVEGDNLSNGFNLNYAELSLQAPIDPFLDLFTVFHLHPDAFEIEEAYATTRGLPFNLTFKAGKFLSHFGRINPQHAHFWNFNDQPLVYEAFFGAEGLNELGGRLSWLAPTPFYLDLGLEVLQGNNEASFGKQGFTLGSQSVSEANFPSLMVATVKSSVDLLDNLVLLGGLSYAQGGSRFFATGEAGDKATGDGSLQAFAGNTLIAGGDLSLRWFIDSYNELSWQNEFLYRHLDGQSYTAQGSSRLTKDQSGLYSQLAWRFGQQWRTGVRLDLLTQNQTLADGGSSSGPSLLPRYSAMVEFLPSEFTRLRLQYELDQSRFAADGTNQAVHGLYLNLNLAMGAHGAHQF